MDLMPTSMMILFKKSNSVDGTAFVASQERKERPPFLTELVAFQYYLVACQKQMSEIRFADVVLIFIDSRIARVGQ
jgi:hypothetical protein